MILEKLLDRFGYVSKKKIKRVILPYSKGIPETIVSEKTYAQLVDAYKSWVYTCIDKISKSIATMPTKLIVYRNSTGMKVNDSYNIKSQLREVPKDLHSKWLNKSGLIKVEIEDHPYLTLIKKPNSVMTRFMLWYETMTRLELGGIVGWYLVKDGLRVPREIWPLPLTQNGILQPKVMPDLTIQYWLYRDGEINVKFDPDEILIIKYPHPKSPFDWFSPLMAQMYPYDIDYYIQQQQANYYKNGVLPSLLAETDIELTKEQCSEILNQLTEEYTTPAKSGKIMLLHSGLKQGNKYSAKDALLDEVTRYAREKIITSYDLSEGKLGLVRDVNRANMESLDKTYTQDCLMPKTLMIEEIIETFLLPSYDNGLSLDFILPENTDKEFELRQAEMELKNYAININEYRNKKGMEPVLWGDVPWGPFGIGPLMDGNKVREPDADAEDEDDGDKSMMTKSMEPVSKWSKEKKKRAWQDKHNHRMKWRHAFKINMIAFFRMQKNYVLEMYNKFEKPEKSILSYETKDINPEDMGFNKKDEAKKLREFFDKFYVMMMEDGGNKVLQQVGSTISFAIDKTAEKYLSDRLRTFSKEVTDTTFDNIQKILTDGYDSGLPYLEIKSQLRQTFERYEKYRAQLITRTECNAAMGKAEILALKQEGSDKYLLKHWITNQGPETRDTHNEAEARYAKGIPINQNFDVGSDTMDMPGNGSLAEENINCVCNVTYSRNEVPL